MTDISPELVERMVKLVRSIDARDPSKEWAFFNEADAIAALLPKQVDPDMDLAREIAWRRFSYAPQNKDAYFTGKNDDYPGVRAALEGIRKGRELANDGWIVWRGGECPVKGVEAEYLMRNGGILGPAETETMDWAHRITRPGQTGDGDIIAYKIVREG